VTLVSFLIIFSEISLFNSLFDSVSEQDYTPQKWQEITRKREAENYEIPYSDVYDTMTQAKYRDSMKEAEEKHFRKRGKSKHFTK
jgi:hypothetical protein